MSGQECYFLMKNADQKLNETEQMCQDQPKVKQSSQHSPGTEVAHNL